MRSSIFKELSPVRKELPLAERPEVIRHLKFNSMLDRDGAENFLDSAVSGEYVIRKSSLGPNCLALSFVTQYSNHIKPHKITSKGLNLNHYLISAEDPKDDQFTKAEDPVEEIRKYIEYIEQHKRFITPNKYVKIVNLSLILSKSMEEEKSTSPVFK